MAQLDSTELKSARLSSARGNVITEIRFIDISVSLSEMTREQQAPCPPLHDSNKMQANQQFNLLFSIVS